MAVSFVFARFSNPGGDVWRSPAIVLRNGVDEDAPLRRARRSGPSSPFGRFPPGRGSGIRLLPDDLFAYISSFSSSRTSCSSFTGLLLFYVPTEGGSFRLGPFSKKIIITY